MEGYDLIVIGAGPGGYVAAIRAAQLGLKTAIVEREHWGGVCLNVGCIPSKCLLEDSHLYHEVAHSGASRGIVAENLSYDWPAMQARKDKVVSQLTKGVEFLLKKNRVDMYFGEACFTDANALAVRGEEAEIPLAAKHFIIATGSRSAELPHIKVDGRRILSSTEALSLPQPPARLCVIGAGAIGLELGSVYARLGTKVTAVEMLPQCLPGSDPEIAATLAREMKKQGITLLTDTMVAALEHKSEGLSLTLEGKSAGSLEADVVLLSVGRLPNAGGLGLNVVGVELSKHDFICVDDEFRTAVPHIFAIGDLIGGKLLAHKASREGEFVAELIAGHEPVRHWHVPAVVYTSPEAASVGLTAAEAEADGFKPQEGSFMFRPNGRALAMNSISGFVKVVADAESGKLLGVHIIGPAAGELIHDAAVALQAGMTLKQYQSVLRAHPTLSEVITEAALAVDGKPIHA
jgi:dihydrolipoamide dehydrogenase